LARTFVRCVLRCALALCLASAGASFAGTSTSPNPTVTFTSTGDKQVELYVCGSTGCANVVKTVTVLDPTPSVAWLNVTPATVPQGGWVSLAAGGAGKPPLSFLWRVVRVATGTTVATILGTSGEWNAIDPPGLYTVAVDVSNSVGTVTSVPTVVTVTGSPFIFGDDFELGDVSRWSAAQ
jgi:hypothetical protein